jgi:hypothetical protein
MKQAIWLAYDLGIKGVTNPSSARVKSGAKIP